MSDYGSRAKGIEGSLFLGDLRDLLLQGKQCSSAVCLALFVLTTLQARADELVQSFTIKEFFGVAHPNQIIDFDFGGSVDWQTLESNS